MRKSLIVMAYFCLGFTVLVRFSPAEEVIKTPGEEVNYVEYTQHEAAAKFLSRLENSSGHLKIKTAGRSLPAQEYGAKDIYLCIITEEGISRPEDLNRDKPTLYIVAAKHGNEQSAKEAALLLIRDLSAGELTPLLQEINVLVLPMVNPYGTRFNLRRNEQNLDLNRDQVKLESPESEIINRVFREWMPEATLDVHEKGDDYYQVSVGCVSNVNIHPSIQDFSRKVILAEIENKLREKDITFHEYLITQRMGIDSSAGADHSEEDRSRRETMKRYSTTDLNDGRNSPGIYETFSFIQEAASRHDLESLPERTRYQYFGIRYLAETVAEYGQDIMSSIRGLRKQLLEKAESHTPQDLVHLRMKYVRDDEEPALTIKKYERAESPIRGILTKDKKAGDTVAITDLQPYPHPSGYKVVEEVVENWFPRVVPVLSVVRPVAYIVPARHLDVIDTLVKHGIKVDFLKQDLNMEVEAYQVTDVIPAEYDYLAPEKIDVEKKSIQKVVRRGDFYISCAQPAAHLIPSLL
ncbi:MAG: DUF2817 domain-containing protein, partial [Candidatus Aminicenantaceae bacterium]